MASCLAVYISHHCYTSVGAESRRRLSVCGKRTHLCCVPQSFIDRSFPPLWRCFRPIDWGIVSHFGETQIQPVSTRLAWLLEKKACDSSILISESSWRSASEFSVHQLAVESQSVFGLILGSKNCIVLRVHACIRDYSRSITHSVPMHRAPCRFRTWCRWIELISTIPAPCIWEP